MDKEKLLRLYWSANKALAEGLTRLAATEWAAAAVVAWTFLSVAFGMWAAW